VIATDTIVLGGGLVGLSTALALARRGIEVAVLEARAPGCGASGANAGGLRRVLRDRAEVPLSVEALEVWKRLDTIVGDDCGVEACGHAELIDDPADFEQARDRVEALRRDGFDHERLIDGGELRRLWPGAPREAIGALYGREDGQAPPARVVRAVVRAGRVAGVAIHEGCAVARVVPQRGEYVGEAGSAQFRAKRIVNCAGAGASRIASGLGLDVPVRAEALTLSVTERLPRLLPAVFGLFRHPLSMKQWPNGAIVIGGGFRGRCERDGHEPILVHLARNLGLAAGLLPQLLEARVVRSWTGVEAVSADGLPVIGDDPRHEGVVHAFGFSGHGYLLAPAVGLRLAAHLCGSPLPETFAAFAPGRFSRQGPAP
jgi:sarcosine oxidase subunit beta